MDWARRIELVTVVVAALVAVVGLWYSNIQTRQANEQAREDRSLAKEGQTTGRYTAAVGNLGEDKMDVRLGGVYALQRIMQDSHRDQPTITNVLATYIRTHTAKPPAKSQDIPADVHAALTVLATRDSTRDGPSAGTGGAGRGGGGPAPGQAPLPVAGVRARRAALPRPAAASDGRQGDSPG
ncbi:hypothetical protein [Streptomyces sp. rh34]|uniref:hypothetical protein n=1 Tax=Streptomyces sp. rh34 TaxID=2034272 RepID=UPI0015CF19FD|nr:hypothetical protein [Streptomyces sp. rh34]